LYEWDNFSLSATKSSSILTAGIIVWKAVIWAMSKDNTFQNVVIRAQQFQGKTVGRCVLVLHLHYKSPNSPFNMTEKGIIVHSFLHNLAGRFVSVMITKKMSLRGSLKVSKHMQPNKGCSIIKMV
jgi:hypothetical protein